MILDLVVEARIEDASSLVLEEDCNDDNRSYTSQSSTVVEVVVVLGLVQVVERLQQPAGTIRVRLYFESMKKCSKNCLFCRSG